MFIAKNNNLIILAKETIEEMEQALRFMVYTSIEETEIEYELYNGEYFTKEEIDIKKKKARNQEIKEKVKELQEMALPEIVKGNSTEEYQKVIDRLLENLVQM